MTELNTQPKNGRKFPLHQLELPQVRLARHQINQLRHLAQTLKNRLQNDTNICVPQIASKRKSKSKEMDYTLYQDRDKMTFIGQKELHDDITYRVIIEQFKALSTQEQRYKFIGEAYILDSSIVHIIESQAPNDPFHFVGLKWYVVQSPTLDTLISPRDFLCLEMTGTLFEEETGEKRLYRILHSVDIFFRNQSEIDMLGFVRGYLNATYLYSLSSHNQKVQVALRANMEPRGKISTWFAAKYCIGFWKSTISADVMKHGKSKRAKHRSLLQRHSSSSENLRRRTTTNIPRDRSVDYQRVWEISRAGSTCLGKALGSSLGPSSRRSGTRVICAMCYCPIRSSHPERERCGSCMRSICSNCSDSIHDISSARPINSYILFKKVCKKCSQQRSKPARNTSQRSDPIELDIFHGQAPTHHSPGSNNRSDLIDLLANSDVVDCRSWSSLSSLDSDALSSRSSQPYEKEVTKDINEALRQSSTRAWNEINGRNPTSNQTIEYQEENVGALHKSGQRGDYSMNHSKFRHSRLMHSASAGSSVGTVCSDSNDSAPRLSNFLRSSTSSCQMSRISPRLSSSTIPSNLSTAQFPTFKKVEASLANQAYLLYCIQQECAKQRTA
uniref:Uncharacterized protein AlNc14C36G3212 n=1 Tax=Albugo laibachii Nc14 TaxID=890382 RepID=F0W8T8_9STRA|nr:conserved hypothetical protein [Albugo laibachii Nc14]|eukprot:CCA17547.1 conserved hypothetical protein [Albugo laibachii Nc14]